MHERALRVGNLYGASLAWRRTATAAYSCRSNCIGGTDDDHRLPLGA